MRDWSDSALTGAREEGRVFAWSDFEAFGFATRDCDPRGRQVFLHVRDVDEGRRLEPGTRISFRIWQHPKGLRAAEVQTIYGDGGRRSALTRAGARNRERYDRG